MDRSFVAEIIGPAGAGKTTLMGLLRNGQNVRSGLSVWRLPHGLLLTTALRKSFSLAAFCVQRGHLEWEDIKLFVQYHALLQLIERESRRGYRALVVDEGNVFALAKLRTFGPSTLNDAWMNDLLERMSLQLNAVVWLDAPNEVLADRIRSREKSHRVKHLSDAEINDHLSRYRTSFEQIIAELGKSTRVKVFRYSTHQFSLEQIAAKVLSEAAPV